jgi:hypothetical protein
MMGWGLSTRRWGRERGPFNREVLNEAFHAWRLMTAFRWRWMNPPSGIMDADAGLFLIKDQKADCRVTVDDIVRGKKRDAL